MDRRTILAIVLSFLIFFGWQKFYLEPRTPKPQQAVEQTDRTAEPEKKEAPAVAKAAPEPKELMKQKYPPHTETLDTARGTLTIGNGEVFFEDWKLEDYTLERDQSGKVDLSSVTNRDGSVRFAVNSPEYEYLTRVRGKLERVSGNEVQWVYEDENVRLERHFYREADAPYVRVTLSGRFKKQAPKYAYVMLSAVGSEDDPEARDRSVAYWTADEIERELVTDVDESWTVTTPLKWTAAMNRYFMLAMVPRDGVPPKGFVRPVGTMGGELSLMYPLAGQEFELPLRAYFGPKDVGLLRQVEPTLENAVDFGFFSVLAFPILQFMKWLYSFVQNYGVAIIIMTVILKIITYPLTYKSVKSMKKMAKLQPKIQKIREKHKDDREAMNREMMNLMRGGGYNPMAGCLPILVQMPVFFALYKVLYGSVELYQAPFALWIADLSQRDPYYVTPILLGLLMFLQQKLTPNTATDPTQQKIMQFMPVMFAAFMLTLPAGLTLYMLVNSIMSIIQQAILNKKFDTGVAQAEPARG